MNSDDINSEYSKLSFFKKFIYDVFCLYFNNVLAENRVCFPFMTKSHKRFSKQLLYSEYKRRLKQKISLLIFKKSNQL